MKKDRIGVLFGGRSQEHEISVLSAASMMDAIDRDRHEVVPVYISRDGAWHLVASDLSGLCVLDDPRMAALAELGANGDSGGAGAATPVIPGSDPESPCDRQVTVSELAGMVDFVFPMLHGPFGEDGTVQGLFETLGLPYAGCGVCGSAVAMDKIFAKQLLKGAGIPVLPFEYVTASEYNADPRGSLLRVEEALGYPVYVKPANMGSSVGVSRADGRPGLEAAVAEALKYDRRVLIEEEARLRELEAAVLGGEPPGVGAVGEIVTNGAFYDYDTKYKVSAYELAIPADIPKAVEDRVRELALLTFKTLDGEGFARVDFFAGETPDQVYVNEMNTIPGFTQYSMFPRLWDAAGLAYPDLIEKIIELGYARRAG